CGTCPPGKGCSSRRCSDREGSDPVDPHADHYGGRKRQAHGTTFGTVAPARCRVRRSAAGVRYVVPELCFRCISEGAGCRPKPHRGRTIGYLLTARNDEKVYSATDFAGFESRAIGT